MHTAHSPKETKGLRTCIVTGSEHAQTDMIRFVLSPDGDVVPDINNRLPGKGAWVTRDRLTLLELSKKNAFARAFKTNCKTPENLMELLETQHLDKFYATLAVLRRTGQVAHGFENARKLLQSQQLCVYLCAADPDTDSRRILEKLTKPELVLDGLAADRLGQVFGSDAIAHVGVASAVSKPLLHAYANWRAVKADKTMNFERMTHDDE